MSLVLLFMFLIAGLTAAPLLVNLDGYKDELVKTIKAATGLDPVVNGTVNVTFIPAPSIIVTNVSIPNMKEGTNADMVNIDSVRVDSSFKALISGKIDIRKIELIHPVLELEELPDGTNNTAVLKEAFKNRDATGQVQFPDKIEIKNGTFVYSDSSRKTTIDYITSTVSAGSINGPFSMDGSFSNNSHIIKFKGYIGELKEGAAADFDMSSDSFTINLKGKYATGDGGKIEGAVVGKATNLEGAVSSFFDGSIASKIKSKETLDLKGNFIISDKIVSFDNIEIASESLSGKASLDALFNMKEKVSNLQWDVNLAIDKVDFDKLFLAEKPTAEKPMQEEVKKDQPDAEVDYYASTMGSASLSDFRFDMPQTLSAMVDFSVKEITYNNDKIQNIKVTADVFDGKAIINSVSADLPGHSVFKFSGNIENNGTRPLLVGNGELSGGSLRKIINWLYPEMSFVPEDKLGEYIISSKVEVTPQRIDFADLNVSFDKSLISGDVSIRPARAIPVIKADVKVDMFDMDKYNLTDKVNELVADFVKTANDKTLDRSWLQMISMKLDLSLDAKDVVYNGYNIDSLLGTLSIARGVFDLQKFNVVSEPATFNSRVYITTTDENNPMMSLIFRSSGFDTALFIPRKEVEEENKTPVAWKWSEEPFNFMGVGRFNSKISIAFKNFKHKNWLLQNMLIDGEIKKKIFTINKAFAGLYGGKILLNGSFGVSEETPSFGISAVGSNVELGQFLKNFYEEPIATGALFFSGTAKSYGKSPAAFISNLVVDSKVSNRNVVFDTFDLEAIIRKAQTLYSVIDMDGVVKEAMSTGVTNFDSIDGKVTTEGGILKATDFQLATKLSRGVFAGNVSLANFDMNGIVKIGFKPEANKKVTLGLDLKGNMKNISRTLDTKELEAYITDKGTRR
jgi:hypothetical protein